MHEHSNHHSFENHPLIEQAFTSVIGQTPIAQVLLQFGAIRAGQALPSGYGRGHGRRCFENAYKLAIENSTLVYHEGFAWNDGSWLPIEHAWCVDEKTGDLVDTTWKSPETGVYYGVPVPRDMLLRITHQTGRYGVFDTGRGFDDEIVEAFWNWTPSPRTR